MTNWEAEGLGVQMAPSSGMRHDSFGGGVSGGKISSHTSSARAFRADGARRPVFLGPVFLGAVSVGPVAAPCHRTAAVYLRLSRTGYSPSSCSAFHPSEGASPNGGRAPLPPPPDRSRQLSGLRVLVVEDDADARELVTAILEEAGAVVEAADSAAAGFAAMSAFRPQLLVSDISMPDEDGYSLIRRVRALSVGGDIPSIALTANTRIEDRARALRAGFTLHMGKPVRPVDLVAAVQTLATAASN